MKKVNILEAKTNFSGLIKMLEDGSEKRIIIARYGKPVAQLSLIDNDLSKRVGVAKGLFEAPADFDEDNAVIAKMFGIDE